MGLFDRYRVRITRPYHPDMGYWNVLIQYRIDIFDKWSLIGFKAEDSEEEALAYANVVIEKHKSKREDDLKRWDKARKEVKRQMRVLKEQTYQFKVK